MLRVSSGDSDQEMSVGKKIPKPVTVPQAELVTSVSPLFLPV